MNETEIKKRVVPRITPSRHEKYMGLAWIHASFSKDPSTQVGSQIVAVGNFPLGSGYNGPPRQFPDNEVVWDRESDGILNKYDIVDHAEINAINHSDPSKLAGATIYVTALPCRDCMREIVRKEISKVVYMDFRSDKSSSLSDTSLRDKAIEIARLGGVVLERFEGSLDWLDTWNNMLKQKGIIQQMS